MEFQLLGPLQVIGDDGRPVELAGPTARTLLAVLLLEAGKVVSADRLIESVWPARAEGASRSTLRYHVSKLRDALERAGPLGRQVVATRGSGYALQVPEESIDLRRFERLVRQGRSVLGEDPAQARRLLGEALDLARGDPLAEFAYQEFATAESRRLEDLMLSALEDRITADLELGRHEEVVGELQGLVVRHPLRERLWARLMLALYRCGRQAEALRAYQAARRALGEELGIETSEELRHLEEQMLLHDPALTRSSHDDTDHRRLPVRLTSFVGRSEEIAALRGLILEHRLVTVLGPPGAGKTRLAIEVAEHLGPETEWVWFVDLAAHEDRRGILDALGLAIGIVRQGQTADHRSIEQRLVDFLRRKRGLLLLDNCEGVAADAGAVAGELLRSCPFLKMLATSRQALGTEGEALWNIPMLGRAAEGAPSAGDAVELFLARARAAEAGFRTGDAEVRRVARICRWLDGLPLAIELAAAQVDVLSLEEIEDRLRGDAASVPSEPGLLGQDRLGAAIESSYGRLRPAEARLFDRLSVCAGGFSLPLAAAMAAPEPDTTGLLASLVRKSLVSAERSGGSLRYRMLEALRRFGSERLAASGSADDARRTHADHLTARADKAWRQWTHWQMPEALGLADVDNLRAALRWLERRDHEGFVRLAGSLGWLWSQFYVREEGWEWTRRALAVEDAAAEDRARVGFAAALTARTVDQVKAAIVLSDAVLAHFRSTGEQHALVRALTEYGAFAEIFSLPEHGQGRLEALDIARTLADDRALAGCLWSQAWAAFAASDPACIEWWRQAEEVYRRSRDEQGWALSAASRLSAEVTWGRRRGIDALGELVRIRGLVSSTEDSWSAAMVENQLRGVYENAGDLVRALEHGRRAVRLFEKAGDETWRALSLGELGCLHRMTGCYEKAARCLLEATGHFRSIGRFGASLWLLETLAELLAAAGSHEAAARLLGSVQAIRRAKGWERLVWDRPDFDEAIDLLRRVLGEGSLARLMEEGSTLGLDRALDEAVARVESIGLSAALRPIAEVSQSVAAHQRRRGGRAPVSST